MLRLLGFSRRNEAVVVFTVERVRAVIVVNLNSEPGIILTALPSCGEFGRGSWHPFLPTRTDNAFLRARHGGQKVGSSLTVGTVEPHLLEIGLRACGTAKVYLVAIVQDKDFIEYLQGSAMEPCR